jgi:hypothetical protein
MRQNARQTFNVFSQLKPAPRSLALKDKTSVAIA